MEEILQYYYTSFINKETGSAGFQVKAMSLGIRPEIQTMIARIMAYRIPPALNERATGTHPVALRYYYLNAQECLLMCSQSNGNDPNGRPGNFFAHVLVVDPSLFTTIPPIFYWKSDFWQKEDRRTRTELAKLTELPGDPALDFDEMWRFLQQKGHLDKLFKLMCAVVDGANSRRRIIIIDTDEHVALWVAAISCMLPPTYRPLLSFTTYHHDPYQSQFFITGTPKEAQFRLSPNDYESYFVLNMPEKKVSEVKESLYAELVCQFATPDTYDPDMLDFFSKYACRFPNPKAIDDQLNLIALYANIIEKERSIALTKDEREAIDRVLSTFEKLKKYTDEDIKHLKDLRSSLGKRYDATSDIEADKLQQPIAKLLNAHQISTDDFLEQKIKTQISKLFIDDAFNVWKYAQEDIEKLFQEYAENNVFINQVNSPAHLRSLTRKAMQAQPHHLVRMWNCIGPYLLPELPCMSLFAQSIQVYGTLRQTAPDLARDLFMAIHKSIQKSNLLWIELIVNRIARDLVKIDIEYLEQFYCVLMLPLSLQEREPYRASMLSIERDIIEIEFLQELTAVNLQKKLPVLLKWVVYTPPPTQLYDPAVLVPKGIRRIRELCNDKQWCEIARQCLKEDELRPFLGGEESQLVEGAFAGITIDQFDSDYVEVYKHYQDHSVLSDTSKVVLSAMVAMQERDLDRQLASNLYNYVSSLPPERYEAEIRSFCNAFFVAPLSDEEHFLLIRALFVWKYEECFWIVYWEEVGAQSSQALDQLIAFWFSLQPLQLPQQYVTHHFLLNLRDSLQSFQKHPDFQKALSVLEGRPWYVAVQESNFVRKNALQTMGQDLMKQVQKRLPNQNVDEDSLQEQRQLRAEMKVLFEQGKIYETHLVTLMGIYRKQRPGQFWEAYKEKLIELLLSNNVQTVIVLFSFWFDRSFNELGRGPYIAQSFFIGLPQVFELARKEHEANFRKMSQQIHSCTTKTNWYPLVYKYLVEVNTVEQKPKWFRR